MILAFDCATATGWCAGNGSCLPILGNVKMPGDVEPGPFLDFWFKWLDRQLPEIMPKVVVFEAPILVSGKTSLATTRKLHGMAGILEMVCVQHRIPCEEVANSTVKKVLTGSGRSEKPDMIRMAQKCGLKPKTHDEADAFGVWIAALHYHAKEHQAAWDQRIYKGSGLL